MGLFAVLGFVASLFIDLGRIVLKVVNVLRPVLTKVFDVTKAIFVRVSQAVGVAVRAVVKGVRIFWDKFLKPIGLTLKRWFLKFEEFLRRVTQPIFDVLQKINDILQKVWDRVIAPILTAIGRVRLVLRGLAALGVDWAKVLDDKLAAVENRIVTTFNDITQFINQITDFLDSLLTPFGWIQGRPWLLSTWKWGGGMASILVGLGIPLDLEERTESLRAGFVDMDIAAAVRDFDSGEFARLSSMRKAVSDFALTRPWLC